MNYRLIIYLLFSFFLLSCDQSLSKKTKKIGFHLGIGVILAFAYIMFMQVSTTFAINSNLSANIATWIPNIIFSVLACILVLRISK